MQIDFVRRPHLKVGKNGTRMSRDGNQLDRSLLIMLTERATDKRSKGLAIT